MLACRAFFRLRHGGWRQIRAIFYLSAELKGGICPRGLRWQMRTFLKILAGIVALAVVVVAGAAAFAQFGSERKLHRTVRVDVTPIALTSDQAALERGAYLYKSRGCAECH